jgi:hypothetical protein
MASRRKFIKDCSALAGSTALVPLEMLGIPQPLPRTNLATIPYRALAALIGSSFIVRSTHGEVSLKLIEAPLRPKRSGVDSGNGHWEAFSLFFRGANRRSLEQRTYSIEHERLGAFELFIVPVDRRDAERGGYGYYEAAFHRLEVRDPAEFAGRTTAVDPNPTAGDHVDSI